MLLLLVISLGGPSDFHSASGVYSPGLVRVVLSIPWLMSSHFMQAYVEEVSIDRIHR